MVSMRVACCYLLSQVMFDRLIRIKFMLGRVEDSYERSEQMRESGGLPPGKVIVTTPIRSLENAQFLEDLPFKGEGHHR